MARTVTVDEYLTHRSKENLWVLVHEKVYNMATFIDEHPGGDEVVLAEAGTDATEAFEDIGHSDEARALLPGMLVGELEEGGLAKLGGSAGKGSTVHQGERVVRQGSNLMYFLPLGFLGAYFAYRFYSTGQLPN